MLNHRHDMVVVLSAAGQDQTVVGLADEKRPKDGPRGGVKLMLEHSVGARRFANYSVQCFSSYMDQLCPDE